MPYNKDDKDNKDDDDKDNDDKDDDDKDDDNDIATKNTKKNNSSSIRGIAIGVIIFIIVIVIIVVSIILTHPTKGVFVPIGKCTTCEMVSTCQAATANSSLCTWCRPFTKGYNIKSKPCYYGYTKTGLWVPRAWDVKSKNIRSAKGKRAKEVKSYKIFSKNHSDPANSKAICVPSWAKCKNCTYIVPSNENKCNNRANDQ